MILKHSFTGLVTWADRAWGQCILHSQGPSNTMICTQQSPWVLNRTPASLLVNHSCISSYRSMMSTQAFALVLANSACNSLPVIDSEHSVLLFFIFLFFIFLNELNCLYNETSTSNSRLKRKAIWRWYWERKRKSEVYIVEKGEGVILSLIYGHNPEVE